jgi:methyl-accepting chemotaxis protein
MYKKLAFIFLLTASLQAMPPKIAQKVEEMHGESDNESGGSSIKSHESPATSYEPHPLHVLPNIEMMEEEVSQNIQNFNEKIQRSNKEKEKLLTDYVEATKILAEKQKEIEELEEEADQLADKVKKVAAQRDEYKSRVDDLERELDQKNKLFSLFASMFSKSNEELDALLEYSKKTLKAEEKE